MRRLCQSLQQRSGFRKAMFRDELVSSGQQGDGFIHPGLEGGMLLAAPDHDLRTALRKGAPYESLDKVDVKDHRTGHVTSAVAAVMDGDIDGFVEAKLRGQTADGDDGLPD